MKKRYEALNWASSFLESHGRYANAGEILLCHVLDIDRSKLFATMHDYLIEDQRKRFSVLVKQHGEGVPIQHLMGYEWFYGQKFSVNPHVLIPRPETEELVLGILQRIRALRTTSSAPLRVVDVGTGSGAIAITLSLENPNLEVSAVDISGEALETAKQNARLLGAGVDFYHGDLLEPVLNKGMFDVIVSNPPYIPLGDLDLLDVTVKNHEPHLALFGGEDGYDYYKRLCQQIPSIIGERALIGFEIGHGQGEVVTELLNNSLDQHHLQVEVSHDINGKERMIFASYNN